MGARTQGSGPRVGPLTTPPAGVSLPLARAALVAAMQRETTGTELPRLVAVLDALIAWSTARPELLTLRAGAAPNPTVGFERSGSKVVFWSVRVTRGEGAMLEIYPPTGRSLGAAERAHVMQTLNAHSRAVLIDGDRLRIGLPALKNETGRAAVLALLDQLLTGKGSAAESPRP